VVEDEELTLEEKRRQLHALEDLEGSDGWRLLKGRLLETARQFSGQVLNNTVTADGVFAQEYAKGRINGIAFSIDLLETAIGSLTMDIREATRKIEETEDDEELVGDGEDVAGEPGEFAP
jgi:hypothetical protein